MPLNHKVSLYNQCWIYGFPDFMTNLLAIQWNARPWCPKYALFSQPQVSQVVLSFLFFQIVNPSIQNLLVRWKLCYHASLKQTYTTHLPHSHAQRGTLFCPRRVLMVQLHVRLFTMWKRFRSKKTFLLCSPFDVKTPKANSEVGFC